MSRGEAPPREDIVRYDAAIRWAVHLERERILKDVLQLEHEAEGPNLVCLADVVRVIG